MPLKPEQFKQSIELLKPILSVGKHEIIFTKANGDRRVLNGTRDPNFIDTEKYNNYMNPPPKLDGTERKSSETSLAVFDLDKNDWRSFKLASLITVNGIDISELIPSA